VNELSIEELTWEKAKKDFSRLNSNLASIIDDIDPDCEHTFIKVVYPYGSKILDKSQLYLPTLEKNLCSFDSKEVDLNIKQKLAYCLGANPVAFVLKNSVELFFELENHIIPFGIVPEGKVFGTWRFLDQEDTHCPKTLLWGLTAGARSIFMLPKISQAIGHNKLINQFNITTDKPSALLDHWETFKDLSDSANFGEKWEVVLLYFTDKWFQHQNDNKWITFYHYLLSNAWKGSGYWRNQFVWKFIYSMIERKRHIKPPAYLAELVEHILTIATGSIPGFAPATNDSLAPVKKLQEIYHEVYGLKEYAPIIMQPTYFSLKNPESSPVYYSLQLPAALEFSLKPRERTTALIDLYHTKSLLSKYVDELKQEYVNIHGTLLHDAITKLKYDFFHSANNNLKDIQDSIVIPSEDNTFEKAAGIYKNENFPNRANFLNGCVRISHKLIK
jgi:hypothetical protein